MPGKTKRKFDGELMRLNKRLNRPLKNIKDILPLEYSSETIIQEFKKYYPLIWKEIKERYEHYHAKDVFLIKQGKTIRYKLLKPNEYLLNLPQIKLWLSSGAREEHKKIFNQEIKVEKEKLLNQQKKTTQTKFETKVSQNTKGIQNVEPLYIDLFIIAYHQKGITTEGKIEIFNELKKYSSKKTADFFYKLNDAERNNQIRKMAFDYLQSIGKFVKLRPNFKGKKKEYIVETNDFDMTPEDLLKKIEKDTIQNKKSFSFFISHSSTNADEVLEAIKSLNKQGYNAYCDWTSDNDFLKRALVSDYTKMVLKKRLEQSENILLLKSKKALDSEWVAFELEYFASLSRPIYFIELDDTSDSRLVSFTKLDYNLEKENLKLSKKLDG